MIDERKFQDKYSAKVTVSNKAKMRKSLQHGKIDLADAYITPIPGQNAHRIHNCFVIYKSKGSDLYIVRDPTATK